MERVLRPGLKDLHTKASTYRARSRGSESIFGQMEVSMMESGMKTKFMGWELIFGLTAENTTACGKTMTCMGLEFICTLMVFVTTVSTIRTRRKDSVFINGLMVASSKVGGTRENSTGLDLTFLKDS